MRTFTEWLSDEDEKGVDSRGSRLTVVKENIPHDKYTDLVAAVEKITTDLGVKCWIQENQVPGDQLTTFNLSISLSDFNDEEAKELLEKVKKVSI